MTGAFYNLGGMADMLVGLAFERTTAERLLSELMEEHAEFVVGLKVSLRYNEFFYIKLSSKYLSYRQLSGQYCLIKLFHILASIKIFFK